MKNNRSGQAAILSNTDYSKILNNIQKEKYKLLIQIARYTGERWGAIVQLKVEDLYYLDEGKYKPKKEITFRAATRKASPKGQKSTRQVPVHATLKKFLDACAPGDGYLFPSPRKPKHPITTRNADSIFRKALEASGIVGASTHSTRRSFITELSRQGVALHIIQKITGHKDIKSLLLYIEVSEDTIQQAIANL